MRNTTRSRALAALLLALGSAATGCKMPEPPGELVGAYHITGKLTENTCGTDALPAVSRLSFDVQIRRNHGSGLWVRDKPPPFSGQLGADGHFLFELSNSYTVNGMASDPGQQLLAMDPTQLMDPTLVDRLDQQAMKSCRLTVDESIEGTLTRALIAEDAGGPSGASAASASMSDLVAENEIAIHAASGTSCDKVLAAQGGPFAALPCHAHYDLEGDLSSQ